MNDSYPWEQVWASGRYATDPTRLKKATRKFSAFNSMGAIPSNLGHVVEIGCGNCALVKIAIARGIELKSYVGIDKSQTALIRAAANISEFKNSKLVLGDAGKLPLQDNVADTILSLGVLEHIDDAAQCISELRRIASPGARLIISTSNTSSAMYAARLIREKVGLWPYGFQRNDSVRSIAKLLQPHFKLRSMRVLHGDSDFILSTSIDRFFGMIRPTWGRYLLCDAVAC